MSDIEKIVEKIRKLRTLADKNANENEAAAATKLADKLFQEYRLEESQLVDSSTEVVEDPIPIYSSARKTAWRDALANILTNHYSCRILIHMGYEEGMRNRTSHYHLIGRQIDINIIKYLFVYLSLVTEGLAERDMKGKGRVNVASYCMGVVMGIAEQLKLNKRELEAAHSGSVAMVALNSRQAEARKWMEEKYKNLTTITFPSGGRLNAGAYASGKAQGLKLNAGNR